MNDIWSKYIQGVDTLFYSRELRFDDCFAERYKEMFRLDECKELKILEIGCGPGVLANALKKWYPLAQVTAIDRDEKFISFAKSKFPQVEFLVGDALNLPFDDRSFDVTISHTVYEHVEPTAFFFEQRRVLKNGGVCLTMASRKGESRQAECIKDNEAETVFWKKVSTLDDSLDRYGVGKYFQTEEELASCLTRFQFSEVTSNFLQLDFVPDAENTPQDLAEKILNEKRYMTLENLASVEKLYADDIFKEEIESIRRIVNEKFDRRLSAYRKKEKIGDYEKLKLQIVRAIKR